MLSIGAFGGQFWSSSFPMGRTTLTGAPAIELTLDMRSSCPPVVARYGSCLEPFCVSGIDDPVWDHSVFSKNRDRLPTSEIAQHFFAALLAEQKAKRCRMSTSR
jgi:hypothetical protein